MSRNLQAVILDRGNALITLPKLGLSCIFCRVVALLRVGGTYTFRPRHPFVPFAGGPPAGACVLGVDHGGPKAPRTAG